MMRQPFEATLDEASHEFPAMKRLFGSGEDTSTGHRELEEKYTKLLGEDNLVGSAGEFGLLFALLANRPDAKKLDGEPTVPLRDVEAMFLEKRLPDGWETWKKSRLDWLKKYHRPIDQRGQEILVSQAATRAKAESW